MAPQLIFGTATFGMDMTEFQDPESVKRILSTAQELGVQRLDTGARYPPRNPGRSEELIGETTKTLLSDSSSFTVDTKIYTDAQTDGSGDLTQDAVEASITASLKRLQRPEGVRQLAILMYPYIS